MTEIYRLSGKKSFRDDSIDRMKTGWGRFVLASGCRRIFDQNYLASYLSGQQALASHGLKELANSTPAYLITKMWTYTFRVKQGTSTFLNKSEEK